MLEHKSVNISFFHSDSFEFADKNKASDDYAYDATGVKLRVRHVSPISAMSSDVTFHMDRFDTAEQSIATLIEVGEASSVKSSLANLMQGLAVSNNMTIASDISGTSKTSSKTTSKSSTSSTLPKVQVSPAFELSEHDEHVTDYYSNLIYEDGVLNKILFDGGCITLEDGSLVYHVYFRDHLGSNRVVADENGNIEQKTHYYAYGGIIGDISTNPEAQKYKYNGKEYETMHGLNIYDYGARQYDPARITWDRMDPLCEKYYNINPYVYCAGNPINAIDPDGRIVRPAGTAELEMIQNTLPLEARPYVIINASGLIDLQMLYSYEGESLNFDNLIKLAETTKYTIDVRLDDHFICADPEGNIDDKQMSYCAYDPKYGDEKDTNGDTTNGLSTGESGFMGKTLFPDRDGLENSPNENIQVIINKNLSPAGAAESYCHEANGHALLYIQNGGDHKGATHQTNGKWINGNKKLVQMILDSKKETIKNMRIR